MKYCDSCAATRDISTQTAAVSSCKCECTHPHSNIWVCVCGSTYECDLYLHEILVSLRFIGAVAGRLAVGPDCLFVRVFGKLSTEHRFICIDICVRVYVAIVCISRYVMFTVI